MTTHRRSAHPSAGNGSPALRWIIVAVVLVALVLVALRLLPGSPLAASAAARWGEPPVPPTSPSPTAATPTPSPSPSLPPLAIRPTTVEMDASGWWSWAMLDLRTGKISGSKNMASTNTTASLIKAWIAADFLRRSAEQDDRPSDTRLHQVSIMIRDSDNEAAQSLYNEIGRVASIKRLVKLCDLTDSRPASDGGWSRTALSPRDTARLGFCLADGRAAGPTWTEWLLDEMRAVRGVGNFGIRKAFPSAVQKTIAIKNGWVDRTAEQEYHVNCLAIGDGWTMGVMTRYPISRGYTYGAEICESVARQLRTD